MAVPSSHQAPNVGTVHSFSPGGIKSRLLLPTQPAPAPVEQASYSAASDSAPFTVAAGQSVTVGFGNLPTQTPGSGPNVLQRQQGVIHVRPFDTLQFIVTLQDATGDPPTVAPLTIDHSGARITGSTLQGGNAYREFRAVVTGGKTASTGTLSASLSLVVS